MENHPAAKALLLVLTTFLIFCNGLPVLDLSDNENFLNGGIDENIENTTPENESAQNLYVVKAVVYEIGILTDVSDENETSSETQERVDLTFFDAHTNSSHIDLGKIPLPVQTNVSGQVLTAIAPVNIGAFSNPTELLNTLPLTGTIVNISHSDTAYFQLSAHNFTNDKDSNDDDYGGGAAASLITADEIGKIPDIADVLPEFSPDQ